MKVQAVNSMIPANGKPMMPIQGNAAPSQQESANASSSRAGQRRLRSESQPLLKLAAASSNLIEIHSKAEFEKELKNSPVPVVVDFYAAWCPPCKAIAPVYEGLSKTYDGQVKFLKVNIDTVKDLANEYKIQSIPTFLFFNQDSSLSERMSGANAALLKQKIETLAKPK